MGTVKISTKWAPTAEELSEIGNSVHQKTQGDGGNILVPSNGTFVKVPYVKATLSANVTETGDEIKGKRYLKLCEIILYMMHF